VAESTRLVDLVQEGIDAFLTEQAEHLAGIASDLSPLADYAGGFLAGGKRFRALFCYWGWQAAVGVPRGFDPLPDDQVHAGLPAIVKAAAALELFHAAALVHDDIIDNSDTRRGSPATHRRFETLHSDQGWSGDGGRFGTSAALLLGDLLLGWSDELFDRGGALLDDPKAALAGRREFNRMRTEVTAGQYLDILEEHAWTTHPETQTLPRAHRVVVYKSAKYSIEAPLAIGASLGGADESVVAALRDFGLPLGIAFQLRDDMLGVFGDPDKTGKPAGDDLREGKRTVLIALARAGMPAHVRRLLDEMLGDPLLDDQQIEILRTAITESGAVDQLETIIERNVDAARTALRNAPIGTTARHELARLAQSVTVRTA
jgi:geranylgeranyl diphosphate synthase type I